MCTNLSEPRFLTCNITQPSSPGHPVGQVRTWVTYLLAALGHSKCTANVGSQFFLFSSSEAESLILTRILYLWQTDRL